MEQNLTEARVELEKKIRERTFDLVLLTEQLRQLITKLMIVDEDGRFHAARILHNDLQQLLISAKLNMEPLFETVGQGQKKSFEKSLELIT